MLKILGASLVLLLLLLGMANPAAAQLVVSDPTNIAQNTITAASEVTSVVNQGVQIANEFKQIEMMVRDLEKLSPQNLAELSDAIQRLGDLYDRANQIGMKWGDIGDEFDALYEGYDPERDGIQGYRAKRKKWQEQTEKSIRAAMISHGAMEDHEARITNLDRMLSASNSASGTLAAIQAGNEIAGVLTKQMMELGKIIIADSRARLSYLQEQESRDAANQARAKEKLFDGYGEMKPYARPSADLPRIR